jgi:hypothetical protein
VKDAVSCPIDCPEFLGLPHSVAWRKHIASATHNDHLADALDTTYRYGGAAVTKCGEYKVNTYLHNEDELSGPFDLVMEQPYSEDQLSGNTLTDTILAPEMLTNLLSAHSEDQRAKLVFVLHAVSSTQLVAQLPVVGALLGRISRPREPWAERMRDNARGVLIQITGQYGSGMGTGPVGEGLSLSLGGPLFEWLDEVDLKDKLRARLNYHSTSTTSYVAMMTLEAVDWSTLTQRSRALVVMVQAICKEFKVSLLADECLCGMGAAGLGLFAFERVGFSPDFVLIGKRFGLSALLARGETAKLCGRHDSALKVTPLVALSTCTTTWALRSIVLKAVALISVALDDWGVLSEDRSCVPDMFEAVGLPRPHGGGFLWMWDERDMDTMKKSGIHLDGHRRYHMPMDIGIDTMEKWIGNLVQSSVPEEESKEATM